jgi:hypothetical protein
MSQKPVVERTVLRPIRQEGHTLRRKRARRERFRSVITEWLVVSGSEGDPFAKPAHEPGLIDLPCRYREHCLDGIVGAGLLVVP